MKKTLYLLLVYVLLLTTYSCQEKHNKIKNKTTTSDLFDSESSPIVDGKKTYDNKCAACHRPNGKGITNAFPPLAQSDYLNNTPAKAIEAVIHGLSGKIKVNNITYNSVMSPIEMTDEEVANVLTYVYSQWGNNKTIITSDMVKKLR